MVGIILIIINCNFVVVFVDRVVVLKDVVMKIGELYMMEEMLVEFMIQFENVLDVYCDIMIDFMSCQVL